MPDIIVRDDKALLEALIADQRSAGAVFNAGDYWKSYAARVVKELNRSGVGQFRRNTRIGKGYVDNVQRNPFDTLDHDSRTHRLYRLVTALPLVQRHVLDKFENAIRASQDRSVQLEGDLLLLRGAAVFEKHAALLRDIETLAGEPEACVSVHGRETALTYLDQLCRIETFEPGMAFDTGRRFMEIGGGFGVNAHLQLALHTGLEAYLYVDIPPMLYVGSQYLRAHFGDEVYTYTDWLRERPEDLSTVRQRLICLPPWALQHSKFTWDRAWNSASFQEMNEAQVDFYVDYLADNAAGEDARMALIYYRSGNVSMAEEQFNSVLSRRLKLSDISEEAMANPHNQQSYFVGRPKPRRSLSPDSGRSSSAPFTPQFAP
jgi:putative sugar O-methyltransferase